MFSIIFIEFILKGNGAAMVSSVNRLHRSGERYFDVRVRKLLLRVQSASPNRIHGSYQRSLNGSFSGYPLLEESSMGNTRRVYLGHLGLYLWYPHWHSHNLQHRCSHSFRRNSKHNRNRMHIRWLHNMRRFFLPRVQVIPNQDNDKSGQTQKRPNQALYCF